MPLENQFLIELVEHEELARKVGYLNHEVNQNPTKKKITEYESARRRLLKSHSAFLGKYTSYLRQVDLSQQTASSPLLALERERSHPHVDPQSPGYNPYKKGGDNPDPRKKY